MLVDATDDSIIHAMKKPIEHAEHMDVPVTQQLALAMDGKTICGSATVPYDDGA